MPQDSALDVATYRPQKMVGNWQSWIGIGEVLTRCYLKKVRPFWLELCRNVPWNAQLHRVFERVACVHGIQRTLSFQNVLEGGGKLIRTAPSINSRKIITYKMFAEMVGSWLITQLKIREVKWGRISPYQADWCSQRNIIRKARTSGRNLCINAESRNIDQEQRQTTGHLMLTCQGLLASTVDEDCCTGTAIGSGSENRLVYKNVSPIQEMFKCSKASLKEIQRGCHFSQHLGCGKLYF